MGIRGLNTFIKKVCPESITVNKISKYSGKIFAIDASILLYKYRHISSLDETYVNSHILGFINRIKIYLINNITPVFVFDGIPPDLKKNTLKKRQTNKKKIYEKIDILKEIECKDLQENNEIKKEIQRLSSQIINVTKKHVDDIKKLLDILGINYYNAPDEAEKYCVYLQNHNIVDYIVTDDTDVFTFGAKGVLKSGIKNDIVEVDILQFLKKIEYSHTKFIDLCILSGCDYLPYVPNLAINTVYSLFKKYDKIEDIIKLDKYKFADEYNDETLTLVRNIFNNFNYETPKILEKKLVNKVEFKNFLESNNIKNNYRILEKF